MHVVVHCRFLFVRFVTFFVFTEIYRGVVLRNGRISRVVIGQTSKSIRYEPLDFNLV